ncbi:MAG: tRNA (adenosine(37)-N6)-dimethylallyltransferase MiaA [Candidatus Pacebacteria bacterium]|nr:tRNA (adenosine(37)-N6)-dimethylallyltransferase MiaA [Candidatus Paceibacterota bacterium]
MSKKTTTKEMRPKIIAVVGPTASGKSDLAVEIALQFDGEVVSVDSRQVYRGLDIGSGKITEDEMRGVPHHLLDVADPKGVFTAADFTQMAQSAVVDILERSKLPIIAGGTGFYLSAFLGETSLPEVEPNMKLREVLEKLSKEELLERLLELDQARAETIDQSNKSRLVRAIEIAEALGSVPRPKQDCPYGALKIGIDLPDDVLKDKIHRRLLSRMEEGMLEEAERLHEEGVSWERMEQLGLEYRYMARHLQGLISREEMLAELEQKIWQYAKRQRTWFKRDKDIKWFSPQDIKEVLRTVDEFMEE